MATASAIQGHSPFDFPQNAGMIYPYYILAVFPRQALVDLKNLLRLSREASLC